MSENKNNRVKVSIVMPVYNLQKYIGDTLLNMTNQTLRDIEIICVNDGSSDDSERIIKEFINKDSRVILVNQENKGAGAARNNGLEIAQGEYIYFFDGDDYCEPDFLEKAVAKIEQEQAQILVFDYYKVDTQTGNKVYFNGLNRGLCPNTESTFNYKDIPYRILSLVIPTPWNKLYLTSYVKETGLKFEEISSTNDITFAALSVAMADKVAYLPEAFVYYRINQKGTITSQKQKKLGNVVIAVESAVEQALRLPYASEIIDSIRYFIIDNYIFALQHYAGRFRTSFYRRYYKKIHQRFNSEIFNGVTFENIKNRVRFEEFLSIKNNSYEKLFFGKTVKIAKKKIKKMLIPFRNIYLRYFESRSKKELREIKKMLKAQKKEIAAISKQSKEIVNIKREVGLISKRVNDLGYIKREVAVISRQTGEALNIGEELLYLSRKEDIDGRNTQEKNSSDEGPRIIVSLTTFPARISAVANVVENMLSQSLTPDKVVLYLSEDNFPNKYEDMPLRLLKLLDRGLEIEWCKGDMRSYKKIIPAIKQYENDIIITVDDDLIYPFDMVERLYDSYRKYPNAISTVRTHRIITDEEGEILSYNKWPKEISDHIMEPRWDLFATTGAGTLFPPHVFDDEALDYEVIKEICPTADDVWFKFMAMRNKVPVVLALPVKKLRYLDGTQHERLWDVNRNDNDIQIEKLIGKYGKEIWAPIEKED